jgi:mannobiose 2-epimerase
MAMLSQASDSPELVEILYRHFTENLLRKWYPLVIDEKCGGYFTNVTCDWHLAPDQPKMIVSQARHMWTTSKAAAFVADGTMYETYARHGLPFLRDFMWDERYGGFFQIRSRDGGYSDCGSWREEKRTYGNAFAICGLAALYHLTKDPSVLAFAKEAFAWLEKHAYDTAHKGYFDFLTREGEPFDASSRYKSVASDNSKLGYEVQNPSIHLLEAYTELYRVWKDDTLKSQLSSLLQLTRDTMVNDKGYLQLFFAREGIPVSSRKSSMTTCAFNLDLGYVSFGHDCATAFLMLEASYALGIEHDARTLSIAKRMLEHAIINGWDEQLGGFYDGGYYFAGTDQCTIIKNTKTWWSQAEALNTLLIFSHIFSQDTTYRELFEKQWEYIDKYLLDHQKGDWLEGGMDEEPQLITGPKGHMWKCAYHTGRALMNCIALLSDEKQASSGIRERKHRMEKLINHWKKT